MEASLLIQHIINVSSQRNSQIKLTRYDDTTKRALELQIVRTKENIQLSYGQVSYGQVVMNNR